jgi:hypothetical protein
VSNWLWRQILGALIAVLLGVALALIVHAARTDLDTEPKGGGADLTTAQPN